MKKPAERSAGLRKAQILIIDDHPIMCQGIRDTLSDEADLEVCGQAGDRASALALLAEFQPDLALVDLSLRNESGLDMLAEIKTRFPAVKTLVFSMHDDALYAERVLRAGALGYVNKLVTGELLIKSIRRALAGETVLNPSLADQLVKQAVQSTGSPRTGVASLSNRELRVFELVGRGATLREVAQQLGVSIKTVESHMEHIKTKLAVDSGRELVRRATLWAEHESGPRQPKPVPE